jgi:mono/diheme cytochrome c family protein
MRLIALLLLLAAGAWAGLPTKRPTDEERGKELYDRHCLACHGADARGQGPATEALVAKVPNLKGQVVADKPTVALVQNGKGSMPAFEASFDNDDTRRVLQWMARLPYEPPAPTKPPKPADDDEPSDEDAGPPGEG